MFYILNVKAVGISSWSLLTFSIIQVLFASTFIISTLSFNHTDRWLIPLYVDRIRTGSETGVRFMFSNLLAKTRWDANSKINERGVVSKQFVSIL